MFREVMGSLWWPVLATGLGFGPGGPEGPLGRMLVFCVRIEVLNSVSCGFGKSLVAGAGNRVRVRASSPGRARRALAPGPEGPRGWMLVFGVRIEVVGSVS